MKTFQDFLIWYNNLDVGPFVKAVCIFKEFYKEMGLDAFKSAISLPGLARRILFGFAQKNKAQFTLMDRANSELYDLINNGITGGPSIVFHRKAIKGKTRIGKGKLVEKVVGYDANSLYLWALDQPLPVGVFVHRRAENGFKPVVRDQLIKAYAWLDFLNDKQDLSIKHMRNNGLEKKVGPYPFDGWDASTGTVYQFHGCYFHGHQCEVSKNENNPNWKENRADYFKATQNTSSFIKESGHKFVEMWECEFSRFAKSNPAVYGYTKEVRPRFYQKQ